MCILVFTRKFFDLYYLTKALNPIKTRKYMSHHTSQHSKTPVPTSTLLDYLDEGRLTDWLSEHGKNILYGLAAVVALIAIVFTFSSRQASQAEQDYIQASHNYTQFRTAQDENAASEALARLQALMSKHSELHAIYDGALAQTFLNRGLPENAQPYASATLSRVASNDLPFYSEYAENTLLIAQQHYQEALQKALTLQNMMREALSSPTRSFGDELFALNLLRIGILQQETGDGSGELQTWQEWSRLAGFNRNQGIAAVVDPQAFRAVIQQLAIGSISLPDYIAHRENILKNKK